MPSELFDANLKSCLELLKRMHPLLRVADDKGDNLLPDAFYKTKEYMIQLSTRMVDEEEQSSAQSKESARAGNDSGYSMIVFESSAVSWYLYAIQVSDEYGNVVGSWNAEDGASVHEIITVYNSGAYEFKLTVFEGSTSVLGSKIEKVKQTKSYTGTLKVSTGTHYYINGDWSGCSVRTE